MTRSLITALLALPAAAAAAPIEVPWQGRLLDVDGAPVEGVRDLTVRLFPTETLGTAAWTGTFEDIDVEAGFVALRLGSTEPLDAAAFATTNALWVEVAVDGVALAPRQPVGVVPHAATADRIRGGVTILGLSHYEHGTRTDTPQSLNVNDKKVVWTVQFNRSSPTSAVRVEGTFPTFRSTQNVGNNFVRVNGVLKRTGFHYNEGVDSVSETVQQADVWFTAAELGTATGPLTVEIGYYALANGNGWAANWFIWNPNATDDPRLEQTVSSLTVSEWAL
jgi:hypothetical protein